MGTTCISTMMFGARPRLASPSSTGKEHDCDRVYATFLVWQKSCDLYIDIRHFSRKKLCYMLRRN
jgi:hypothetical protein